MNALALLALLLGIVVGVWAITQRAWPLALLALAVVFLAVEPGLSISIH
jgi:hypothetical protein